MSILRLLILFSISALLWVQPAFAEKFYPLITYNCDTAADIIKVTNSLLPAEEGKNYNYSDANGTYSPWNMIDVNEQNGKTKVTNIRKITKVCKLSSGEYTTILEPQVFNRDLSGRCADSISGAVTIEYDGYELQERLPFESYCHGNAPVIIRVTVFGKTSEVKIKRIPRYKFY